MLERCYSVKCHKRLPTYIGCSVCKEWLTFSTFKAWMKSQVWRGRHLDKDLVIPYNKVYSPETCLFVPGKLNTLINNQEASRGRYPQGVNAHSPGKRFVARCRVHGRKQHLGYFDTVAEAAAAYRKAKATLILEIAEELEGEPILYSALVNQANLQWER